MKNINGVEYVDVCFFGHMYSSFVPVDELWTTEIIPDLVLNR